MRARTEGVCREAPDAVTPCPSAGRCWRSDTSFDAEALRRRARPHPPCAARCAAAPHGEEKDARSVSCQREVSQCDSVGASCGSGWPEAPSAID